MTFFRIGVFANVIKVKVQMRSYGIKVDTKSNENILRKDGEGHRGTEENAM